MRVMCRSLDVGRRWVRVGPISAGEQSALRPATLGECMQAWCASLRQQAQGASVSVECNLTRGHSFWDGGPTGSTQQRLLSTSNGPFGRAAADTLCAARLTGTLVEQRRT